MTDAIRVLVLAPSPVVRAGLAAMLAEAGGFEVETAEEPALSEPEVSLTELSRADVVLVADEGLLEDAAPAFVVDGSQAVVLLSEDVRAAAKLGPLPVRGWGILSPDASPEELGAAVSAVAQGLIVLPGLLADELLDLPEEAGGIEEPPDPLTAREHEVLGLLARGLSNKMIARELRISEHTVKFHISSLYVKLDVGNRAEAVSRGARHGLISL